jgi:hypothetical protein
MIAKAAAGYVGRWQHYAKSLNRIG